MTWYILKGEDLKREQKINFPFYRTLPETYTPDQLIFQDELIQSENKLAPTHPSRSATKINCVLTADLTKVDRSQFKRRVGHDGGVYYDIFYELAVTMQPANMKFALEMNGKEMGSVDANYG